MENPWYNIKKLSCCCGSRRAYYPKEGKRLKTFLRIIATLLLVTMLTGVICVGAFAWYVTSYLDTSLNIDVSDLKLNLTSIVYYTDENGNPVELERLHQSENRIWADSNEIPQNLKDAIVAIEDERFSTHKGVDWKRTIGAVLNYVLPLGGSYGGSTITQQLIKNLTDETEVRPDRKIKEIIRALELEKKYTKDEILTLYLNTIFLGSSAYGVQAAANTYFGKDVSELSLAECACVAGITNSPTKYNPFLNPENNKERQEVILNKMQTLGMISAEECEAAKAEPLVFQREQAEAELTEPQSYFVDQVIEDVLADLQEELGYSYQTALLKLYNGGLRIYATIDPEIQAAMDTVFQDDASFPNISDQYGTLPQAAMVVLDPNTGDVLGIEGGRGEKEGSRVLNRATQTTRAPGSTIKPLSVYAPAIENDVITWATVLDDSPYDVATRYPKNQNNRYQGRMTIRRGVGLSLNTIAVKVLAMVTPEVSFNFMTQNLKFTTLVDAKQVNGKVKTDIAIAPMALGGLTNGVTVMEMAQGYTPFANAGMLSMARTYTKVMDSDDKLLLDNEADTSVAMSEQTAFIVHKLLQGVCESGTGTAARFSSSIPVAGKTGTTDNDYDRWFVGYTPYYLGAVWFGYDQQTGIPSLSVNPALYLWKLVMQKIHDGKAAASFSNAPAGIVQAEYCVDSGCKPTALCKEDVRGNRVETGWFKAGTEPKETCTAHVEVDICTDSNQLAGPYCPDEKIKKTVMLCLDDRDYPQDLVIEDSQYVVTLSLNPISGEQTWIANSKAGGTKEGAAAMNQPCSVHTQPLDSTTTEDGGTPDTSGGTNSGQTGSGGQTGTDDQNGDGMPDWLE